MREEIIHEKTERNQLVIGKLMNTTYGLRCQEIIETLVRDVVDRWPALLIESRVKKRKSVTDPEFKLPLFLELETQSFSHLRVNKLRLFTKPAFWNTPQRER